MRNDFGNRPYKERFPYSKGDKKQGPDARLDESLGERRGAEATKPKALNLEEMRAEERGKHNARSRN
tara:strand:- start:391 stop:591 length:201 start_codon:yes stop_codon:yes gene_type:complete